ncbi:hypothetical protein BYT27DRAFT_7084104 [Phlegmacium glaucopus]|nr:hypothetical protein BYT27DRAFT_7084104 [Phlegmacium glaucopus]
MASTSKAHPSIQRLNNAYVQVPVSPLSLTTYRSLKAPILSASSMKLKENTPLRPLQFTTIPSMSHKRKRSDCDSIHDGPLSVVKKAKLVVPDGTPSKARSQPIVPTANACPDFPNGYVYCHQCSKKRDILTTIQCNIMKHCQTKGKGTGERHCVNKYCKGCLKRKYNEDFDVLQGCTKTGSASFFTCPRCRGVCNCWKCKKTLGIEATSLPGSHPNIPVLPKTAKVEKKPQVQTARTKAKDILKPTKKVLPQLKWTPVPSTITQAQAEERIFIREFALRFADIMGPSIAKSSLEELGFIAGKINSDEDVDMLAWVSGPCVKGLVLGLLGLLAKDHETDIAQEIKTAIKTIRSAGVNLNKMWLNLVVLRDNVASLFSSTASTSHAEPSVWVPLTFPDPSPAPLSATQHVRSLRNVRSVTSSGDIVNVVHTAQMIPVIISLIHLVLETAIVREEIDQGIRNARDVARDAKEATRIENERWDKERKNMEDISKDKDKAKRKAHKDRISDINNVVKLTAQGFTPRFSILGMDNEGRTYYALSPGVQEREIAFEYLEVVSIEKATKLKKKGRILTAEDRREMKEWSWFVGVWGKKPPSDGQSENLQPAKKLLDNVDTSDEMEDGEEVAEKWWGFWEHEEITRLADWITIKSKLGDEEDTQVEDKKDPAKMQLKHLVTQLKDYATLLEWRVRDDKFNINDAPALE